jgi:hypothetical protein
MAAHPLQPGDRVIDTAGHGQSGPLGEHLKTAPVLVVVRQMKFEPQMYELSDGKLYNLAQLHLVERPAAAAADE